MEPEVEGMMLFYHTHVRRAREEREPVVPRFRQCCHPQLRWLSASCKDKTHVALLSNKWSSRPVFLSSTCRSQWAMV